MADKEHTIGLDYASDGLYVDDKGNIGTNHKYYRESQKKLAKEQRKLSRKMGSKKGETKSNNYKKQQRKINKIHRHIANQRLDNLHKKSTWLSYSDFLHTRHHTDWLSLSISYVNCPNVDLQYVNAILLFLILLIFVLYYR